MNWRSPVIVIPIFTYANPLKKTRCTFLEDLLLCEADDKRAGITWARSECPVNSFRFCKDWKFEWISCIDERSSGKANNSLCPAHRTGRANRLLTSRVTICALRIKTCPSMVYPTPSMFSGNLRYFFCGRVYEHLGELPRPHIGHVPDRVTINILFDISWLLARNCNVHCS